MATTVSEIEKRLWSSADEFRANSNLKSSEYSVPVLGLIFLRYADHRFTQAEKVLAGKGSGRPHQLGGDKRLTLALMSSLFGYFPGDRILSNDLAVELNTRFGAISSGLLVQESDTGVGTFTPHDSGPVLVFRPIAGARFTTVNDPIDALKIQVIKGPQSRFI